MAVWDLLNNMAAPMAQYVKLYSGRYLTRHDKGLPVRIPVVVVHTSVGGTVVHALVRTGVRTPVGVRTGVRILAVVRTLLEADLGMPVRT